MAYYPKTAQGMFNRVWNHFVVNKAPLGVNGEGACVYRGENGSRCAVGVLVSDAECSNGRGSFVNGSVRDLVTEGHMPARLRPHLDLLEDLQGAHDCSFRANGTNRRKPLRAIAKKHGLRIPREVSR